MDNVLLGLSRYVLPFLIALYALNGFLPTPPYMQTLLLMLFHLGGFTVLSIRMDIPALPYACMLELLIFIGILILWRVLYPKADQLILNHCCMFLSIGSLMICRLSWDRFFRQLLISGISLCLCLMIPLIMLKFKNLRRFTWTYGLSGILLLSIVMAAGAVSRGARLSWTIAGVTFQPSEFVKIIFVFYVAGMLSPLMSKLSPDEILMHNASRRRLISATLVSGAHILILVLSRDLGSALIFFIVYAMMLYAALRSGWVLVLAALGGSMAAVLGYQFFSHVRTRVLAWRDPFSYIDGQGYQITQSLFAIGTGGWFGMGLNMGSPDKIPIAAQDFIFSAIAEELGSLSALCLILICISTFLLFMNIAMSTKEAYYKLVALGLSVTYIFQVFLTLGGVTKFIPLTGVTLPLVSYGGSSILSMLIIFSLIQGIYLRRMEEKTAPFPERYRPRQGIQGNARKEKNSYANGKGRKKQRSQA